MNNASAVENCNTSVTNPIQIEHSTVEDCTISTRSEKQLWNIFGYSLPKQEVMFFCQVFALYIVIIVCLVEIVVENGENKLWFSLLAGSIGYLLPNPTLKKETIIIQQNMSPC